MIAKWERNTQTKVKVCMNDVIFSDSPLSEFIYGSYSFFFLFFVTNKNMVHKKAIVFLTEGAEDMEFSISGKI